ncbi:HlyD family secretion protein [Methylocystis heyeri]|uniref:HlyD family efflux transporter periplasmic adaptor subunit n=1 Tax=Methylocystis heyeri TaxID=391905 RepID=A0A6B8KD73_9HYPH|nr:HlyD family efflux transporter periplasmic adaptor subunit [Methylocystis heyeri]QGM45637.1 HlyD family efflux transporter periplasmic adaptor subunit [Methylocystis heyeri]
MKRAAAAVVLGLAILWFVFGGARPEDGAYLGYVEGDLLYIGPIEGERLGALSVESGDQVAAGALLFEMETPLLEAQRREAADRISQMRAQLENLQAALNRPQQVAVLEATVERRKAELLLSQQNFERQKILYAQKDVSKATLDNAQMALSRDEANLKEAERQVDAALLTGRTQEIRAAEAAMQQAGSALNQIKIRIERQRVHAPAAGVVQEVFFRRGETVTAGQPVLSLLPPENRKARFYAPQARLARFRLGGRVRVACDGCADNLYAKIFYISGREEFTPPVIFSDDERQKLVFKIEARMEGAATELPLGLPLRIYPLAQAAK